MHAQVQWLPAFSFASQGCTSVTPDRGGGTRPAVALAAAELHSMRRGCQSLGLPVCRSSGESAMAAVGALTSRWLLLQGCPACGVRARAWSSPSLSIRRPVNHGRGVGTDLKVAVAAGLHGMRRACQSLDLPPAAAFQLLGADFLVDQDLKVQLVVLYISAQRHWIVTPDMLPLSTERGSHLTFDLPCRPGCWRSTPTPHWPSRTPTPRWRQFCAARSGRS